MPLQCVELVLVRIDLDLGLAIACLIEVGVCGRILRKKTNMVLFCWMLPLNFLQSALTEKTRRRRRGRRKERGLGPHRGPAAWCMVRRRR